MRAKLRSANNMTGTKQLFTTRLFSLIVNRFWEVRANKYMYALFGLNFRTLNFLVLDNYLKETNTIRYDLEQYTSYWFLKYPSCKWVHRLRLLHVNKLCIALFYPCFNKVHLRCNTPVSPGLFINSAFCTRFNSRRWVLISVSTLEIWPSNFVNRSSCLAMFL